jgi:hypothetical protein
MTSIPGFWDIGPHDALPVEATWDEFVQSIGGERISSLLSKPPDFENADYFFENSGVVAELKEIVTEFSRAPAFRNGFDGLMKQLIRENPAWKPSLFGGRGGYPKWFYPAFVRLFRPPISRVLKKANRQIRETKLYLGQSNPTGVLLFVNDGFTTLGPGWIQALASSLLVDSYRSIDCFVYITVNRYVIFQGSDVPRLVWVPSYSDRADNSLHQFINELGQRWIKFLEGKIGPFVSDARVSEDLDAFRGSKALVLPVEHGNEPSPNKTETPSN